MTKVYISPMPDQINKILQSIGLTKEEVKVYLACLELAESSVQDIAKKAGTKRPTTYKILDSLLEKAVVFKVLKGKKTLYSAEDPQKLYNQIKQKQSDLKKILPELNSIYNLPVSKPKIKFYEGVKGAIAVYDDILATIKNDSEVLSYTALHGLFKYFPQDYAKQFFATRVRRNITTRIIALESKEALAWQKKGAFELRDILLVKKKDFPLDFFGDTEIYANKTAIISYRDNFMAIIIESNDIANMQRFIFELAWKNLKKNK